VRGTLPANSTLKALKRATGANHLERIAVLQTAAGKKFLLAPVGIDEGIDGLVHISDLSWTKRIKHPSEVLKKGDDVQAVILSIDAANQKLSLGIKQLEPDRWESWFNQHNVGDVVRGKVARMTNFGAFVDIGVQQDGLVHLSQMSNRFIRDPREAVKVGDVVQVKVISVEVETKRIGLSMKALMPSLVIPAASSRSRTRCS
jgi:small subunit ribosomal protein S1